MGKKSNGDPNLIRKGLTRGKREELKKLVDELLQSKSQLLTSNCLLAVIKFLQTPILLFYRMFLLSNITVKRFGNLLRILDSSRENI